MIRRKSYIQFLIFILLLIFEGTAIPKLQSDASFFSFDKNMLYSDCFRSHELTEEIVVFMQKTKEPSRTAGLYLLEKQFQYGLESQSVSEHYFYKLDEKWRFSPYYSSYMAACEKIWADIENFPVMFWKDEPELTVSYENSWMNERTYGGKRGHEGTDLMASENIRGIFPIVSMTDGTVINKGWLPKGGWRIGISAPHGGYFYYAHLDSYSDIEIGDQVKAGDIIGYMGDSGYGQEGTTGKFPVHLHLGIYLDKTDDAISINPYWILKYAESSKLFCRKND